MLEYFGLALATWFLLICFNVFLSIVVYRKVRQGSGRLTRLQNDTLFSSHRRIVRTKMSTSWRTQSRGKKSITSWAGGCHYQPRLSALHKIAENSSHAILSGARCLRHDSSVRWQAGVPSVWQPLLLLDNGAERTTKWAAQHSPRCCPQDEDSSVWDFSFFFIEILVFVGLGLLAFGASLVKLRR